jgi:hypothetical protein
MFRVGKISIVSVFCIAFLVLFSTSVAHGQDAPEKQRIAFSKPVVGPEVASGVRPHLNLDVLVAEIEKALLNTRKFEVLTRGEAQIRAILEEQDLATSSMSPGNAAPGGMIEAADYIVLPTVRAFRFSRGHSAVPNVSDKWFRQDSGALEVDVQIVDTATGQVKAVFTMNDRFSTGRDIVNSRGGAPSSARFNTMAVNVAGQMAEKLVDAVFPMMVIAVQGSTVYVNRGEDGGLRQGEVLSVFRPGVQLVDPYTGEVLGSAETEVGAVRVVRVNPRFTMADVVADKTAQPPLEGDILRRP